MTHLSLFVLVTFLKNNPALIAKGDLDLRSNRTSIALRKEKNSNEVDVSDVLH